MGKHKATTVTKTLSRVTTVVRGRALRDHSRMGRAVGSGGSIRIAWLGLLLLPTATQAFSILSSVAKSRKRGSRQPTRSPGLVANLLNNWTDVTKMPRRAYFPYGQKGFAKIREQGRFYVDRTEYIEALEAFEYQCFTRPPRWGSSTSPVRPRAVLMKLRRVSTRTSTCSAKSLPSSTATPHARSSLHFAVSTSSWRTTP